MADASIAAISFLRPAMNCRTMCPAADQDHLDLGHRNGQTTAKSVARAVHNLGGFGPLSLPADNDGRTYHLRRRGRGILRRTETRRAAETKDCNTLPQARPTDFGGGHLGRLRLVRIVRIKRHGPAPDRQSPANAELLGRARIRW